MGRTIPHSWTAPACDLFAAPVMHGEPLSRNGKAQRPRGEKRGQHDDQVFHRKYHADSRLRGGTSQRRFAGNEKARCDKQRARPSRRQVSVRGTLSRDNCHQPMLIVTKRDRAINPSSRICGGSALNRSRCCVGLSKPRGRRVSPKGNADKGKCLPRATRVSPGNAQLVDAATAHASGSPRSCTLNLPVIKLPTHRREADLKRLRKLESRRRFSVFIQILDLDLDF